jgi:hypothetical protein
MSTQYIVSFLIYCENSKIVYNDLGCKQTLGIQINPVITNRGYNEPRL